MTPQPASSATFSALGIRPDILRVLDVRKLVTPTPIQHQAIPVALEGKDVVGIAQTGTGKTWAFGIPLLQRLAEHGGRALVLVPTRELAAQVEESLLVFAPTVGLRTAVFVGGASFGRQRDMLRANPRVLIATPGRLNDHLEQGTITLKEVKILVLDEADRMLDMGFKPQIERILKHVPRERQTMLFSATMPQDILRLANTHMKTPLRIEVAPQGTAAQNVEQELFIVRREEKLRLLENLLQEYHGTVLLFSRTKHGAKKITHSIHAMGHTAAEIHANRSLGQRREALQGFKNGRYRVLVATDIASRGIDVTAIETVINFDLPDDPSDYVHRIGRTARAGREGRAISFATPDQAKDIRNIESLIRTSLRRKPLPVLPPARIPVAGSTTSSFDGAQQERRPWQHHQSRQGGGRPFQGKKNWGRRR
ncbi:MAG: DEAD/DEAH box helicase [Candidatus Peribacteraceae bacterium]|nr:DEAD/DEAH box helicase [Candidatus Peribacteraceae bacterium]